VFLMIAFWHISRLWRELSFVAKRKPAREILRAKLLACGNHEHHAYHPVGRGCVIMVDAEIFYLALLSGVDDFWELVASTPGIEPLDAAVLVDGIHETDGKSRYSRIYSCSGEAYVDTVFPRHLPYPYLCTWLSADEFKKAVVEREAEAADCGEVDECLQFHD
ncbi:MAG: hypothetical protein J6V72_15745, partial [Kiritimatiellae bacterium]|nr:hypothetical protein [Kiritimatiellia bacterium]